MLSIFTHTHTHICMTCLPLDVINKFYFIFLKRLCIKIPFQQLSLRTKGTIFQLLLGSSPAHWVFYSSRSSCCAKVLFLTYSVCLLSFRIFFLQESFCLSNAGSIFQQNFLPSTGNKKNKKPYCSCHLLNIFNFHNFLSMKCWPELQ